jgi:hypothetical protein
VNENWIIETRNNFTIVNRWRHELRDAAAASAAMQVHLPQDQMSRLTLSISDLNNTTGYGIGYAYMLDNKRNTALTLSVGHAGEETAVRGSFGFEFGGQRKIKLAQQTTIDTQLTTIDTLREQLTMVENERTIERKLSKESRERITEMCEESKDRIFAACQK